MFRLLQWPIRAQENSKAKGEEPMREKKKHGNDVKCGKTMVTKTRLNLDSYLIGRDGGGSSFLDQSRRELDLYQNNPGFRLLQKQWKTGLKLLNYWLFFYI